MKRLFVAIMLGISATVLLTGCLALQLGPDSVTKCETPTVGQQLTDLQKARKSGAITEAEYEAKKAKLLENK
jgi:hypothetical protein